MTEPHTKEDVQIIFCFDSMITTGETEIPEEDLWHPFRLSKVNDKVKKNDKKIIIKVPHDGP